MRRALWLLGPVLIAVAGVLAAAQLDPYLGFVVGLAAVYALAALGLSIPAGWTGEISVGHAGIMAVASYATVSLHVREVVPSLLLGAAVGLLAGCVLGLPALRLRGFGLAIVTLVFGEFVRIGIGALPGLGGTIGRLVPTPVLFDSRLDQASQVGVACISLAVGLVVAGLVRRSTLGRAWRAVRDNEPLARAFGCNPPSLRLGAFAASGLFCGSAGVMLGWLTRYQQPDAFDLWLSIYLLAIVVIGGRDELYGPVVGAAVMVIGAEGIRAAREFQAIAFGLALLLVVWFMPSGVFAACAEWLRRRARVRARSRARTAAG